jgi:hypothetical protein
LQLGAVAPASERGTHVFYLRDQAFWCFPVVIDPGSFASPPVRAAAQLGDDNLTGGA